MISTTFFSKNPLLLVTSLIVGLGLTAQALHAATIGEDAYERIASMVELPPQDLVVNIHEMDGRELHKGEATTRPWAGWSWPDHLGSIANPYAKRPSTLLEQSDVLRYLNVNRLFWQPARSLLTEWIDKYSKIGYQNLTDEQIMYLSPSEKYDLLLDQYDIPFTRNLIARVTRLQKKEMTASWTGICHGWAPASLTYSRPTNAFEVKNSSGQTITFFPDDIKALTSYLFGQQVRTYQWEGWRCEEGKSSKRDQYGRISDARCNDVDPAAFHLIAVNRIGLLKKGMVMDIKYNSDVFNQPTYKYEYSYFNPITGSYSDKLSTATVSLEAKGIPYRKFRDPRTAKIVGVAMDITYVAEVAANDVSHDSVKRDAKAVLRMQYDLELDTDGNIVGGEWRPYRNALRRQDGENAGYAHPDFIWFPGKDLDIATEFDKGLKPIRTEADFRRNLGAIKTQSDKAMAVTNCDFTGVCGYPAPLPLKTVVDWLHGLSQ